MQLENQKTFFLMDLFVGYIFFYILDTSWLIMSKIDANPDNAMFCIIYLMFFLVPFWLVSGLAGFVEIFRLIWYRNISIFLAICAIFFIILYMKVIPCTPKYQMDLMCWGLRTIALCLLLLLLGLRKYDFIKRTTQYAIICALGLMVIMLAVSFVYDYVLYLPVLHVCLVGMLAWRVMYIVKHTKYRNGLPITIKPNYTSNI